MDDVYRVYGPLIVCFHVRFAVHFRFWPRSHIIFNALHHARNNNGSSQLLKQRDKKQETKDKRTVSFLWIHSLHHVFIAPLSYLPQLFIAESYHFVSDSLMS